MEVKLIGGISTGVANRLLLFFFFNLAGIVLGQAPSVDTVSSLAVQPGQTVRLVFSGKNLTNVSSLWASFPVFFEPVRTDLDKDDRATFDLTIPPEVPVQIGAVRLAGPKGLGPIRLLMIDDLPNLKEVQGNHLVDSAQFVAGPIGIDGIGNGVQFDWFEFQVSKYESISFEVVANRLGSNFDPEVKLFDATGQVLAKFGDSNGIAPDLQFRFQFANAGRYFLRLRDMAYQGGRGSFFRLRIGGFPIVSGVYPQGGKFGELVPFYPVSNQELPPVLTIPSGSNFWINFKMKNGLGSAYRRFVGSVENNNYEIEPNNERLNATIIDFPTVINGRFEHQSDRDWFELKLDKGSRVKFEVATRRLGSPCDLFLSVFGSEGAVLAMSELIDTSDGELSFEAKKKGIYYLEARELADQFGKHLVYRINAKKELPSFNLTVDQQGFMAKAGEQISIKVNAKRFDYKGPIQLKSIGVASAWKHEAATIEKGKNETTLKLTLPLDVKPGSLFDFTISGIGINGIDTVVKHSNSELLKKFQLMIPFPPVLETRFHAVVVE